ncbi:UNVERIFIED_CONTAM: exonuclease domain-containing protein [Campylobacter lari]
MSPASSPFSKKIDNAEVKRVELHACTKMNTMDSLVSASELVKRTKEYGMTAIGIMDTDGAQGYPELYNSCKKAGIKGIYGTSFSVIPNTNDAILGPIPQGKIKDYAFVSFDIETTGLSPRYHELIEFGAMEINESLRKVQKHQFFIKPKTKLSRFTIDLTGITDEMIEKEGFDTKIALVKIYDLLNNRIALAHNAKFDYNFLKEQFRIHELPFPNVTVIDTLVISRMMNPDKRSHKLEDVSNRLGIKYDPEVAHRGDYDANVLADV